MQINSIKPKTGNGDNNENKKPRVIQLVCSSTNYLDLHSYLVLSTYLQWLWSSDAKMSKVKKMQREIIKKVSKLGLSILCIVCLFMWFYIPTRYHPNILKSFGAIEYTQIFKKKCKWK